MAPRQSKLTCRSHASGVRIRAAELLGVPLPVHGDLDVPPPCSIRSVGRLITEAEQALSHAERMVLELITIQRTPHPRPNP
jgi:hypothetical protein